MKNCIFCDIISRKTFVDIIFENKFVIAFLDLNPISKGHTLIVTKKHFKNLFDAKSEIMKEVGLAIKKVSLILKTKLDADGINVLHASGATAQQSVFHLHFHIVPRYKNDLLDTWPNSNYKKEKIIHIFK